MSAFDRVEDAARYEVVCGGFDPVLFRAASIRPADRAFRDFVSEGGEGDARAALTDAARAFETPEGVRLRSTAWLVVAS
ncbi:hypothetical protein [Spirillospora sp. CA-128828]|uniref:hypothetical protein n=1 Tax=Spirillospora sp. CA-128828 TaxID=3240033 RepID=UPI003D8DA144